MTNRYERDGLLAAQALVSKAARNLEHVGVLWGDVEAVVAGDSARETVMGLATLAGILVDLYATSRAGTVDGVLDLLSEAVVEGLVGEESD